MAGAGPTVLVTGGAQGIGLGIAEQLLGRGYAVVAADSDAEAGREAEQRFAARPFRFAHADVSQQPEVARAVAQALEAFGRLDALVNNAGISRNRPLAELSLDDWNAVIATNLTGAFLCAKHAAPHLARAKGAIVNIASSRALMSEPDTEAYSASKGGLVALTHALAISLGPAVRVNAVSPGWIEVRDWQKSRERRAPEHSETDRRQHPAGRVGRPEDVAALVRYLISEESGFVTGQNFVVDGGMTKKMTYAD